MARFISLYNITVLVGETDSRAYKMTGRQINLSNYLLFDLWSRERHFFYGLMWYDKILAMDNDFNNFCKNNVRLLSRDDIARISSHDYVAYTLNEATVVSSNLT